MNLSQIDIQKTNYFKRGNDNMQIHVIKICMSQWLHRFIKQNKLDKLDNNVDKLISTKILKCHCQFPRIARNCLDNM